VSCPVIIGGLRWRGDRYDGECKKENDIGGVEFLVDYFCLMAVGISISDQMLGTDHRA
jgi:hypothetical protein